MHIYTSIALFALATYATAQSQISDGQIQVPTTTVRAVTQISDGQIQATTAIAPISQITDGQIQAPKTTVAAVTQITDGQPQVPTSVSVAPKPASTTPSTNATVTSAPIVPFKGSASAIGWSSGVVGVAVAVVAFALL